MTEDISAFPFRVSFSRWHCYSWFMKNVADAGGEKIRSNISLVSNFGPRRVFSALSRCSWRFSNFPSQSMKTVSCEWYQPICHFRRRNLWFRSVATKKCLREITNLLWDPCGRHLWKAVTSNDPSFAVDKTEKLSKYNFYAWLHNLHIYQACHEGEKLLWGGKTLASFALLSRVSQQTNPKAHFKFINLSCQLSLFLCDKRADFS